MEEDVKTFGDYVAILKRRALYFLLPFIVLVGGSVSVAMFLPPIYESKATILIESQQIPRDLVRSTVTSFADERIQVIKQRVMTSSTLVDIINKFDLYKDERKKSPRSVIVDNMRNSISVRRVSADVIDPQGGHVEKATIAFTISFESERPQVAQTVTNEIVTRFLSENTRTRTESASQTAEFLTRQVNEQGQKIAEIEQQIGAYKDEYQDALPENLGLNQEMLRRAEDQLNQAENEIINLQERQTFLNANLTALKEMSPKGNSKNEPQGPRETPEQQRLKELRAKYVSLAAVYGESHPDVQAARRQLEAFEKEATNVSDVSELEAELKTANEELAQIRNKYSDQHPDVVRLREQIEKLNTLIANATPQAGGEDTKPKETSIEDSLPPIMRNPSIISLQAEVVSIPSRIERLRKRQDEVRSRIKELEQKILKTPNVARGLSSLQREFDNASTEFDRLKAKQQSALLSEELETAQKAEKFTLLEPPVLPENPVKPDRIKILVMGIVFSLMGGAGIAGAAEFLDGSVRGPRDLANIINRPPLAVIPFIETSRDRRRRTLLLVGIGILLLVLGIGAVLGVNYLYKPLDILWPMVLRRFGIF